MSRHEVRAAVTSNVELNLTRCRIPDQQGRRRIATAGNLARIDRLRAHFDAVLIGEAAATVSNLAPAMITSERLRAERRSSGRQEHPVNVVVTRDATWLVGSRLLSFQAVQIWVCTTHQTPPDQLSDLEHAGTHVCVAGGDAVDLAATLQELRGAGIELVFVEGDDDLNAELAARGLVDELAVYVSPIPQGRHDVLALASALGEHGWLDRLPHLSLTVAQEVDDDLMLYYDVLRTQ